MLLFVGALALFIGWVLGMVTRQRSSHWCCTCGAALGCIECRDRARRVLVR